MALFCVNIELVPPLEQLKTMRILLVVDYRNDLPRIRARKDFSSSLNCSITVQVLTLGDHVSFDYLHANVVKYLHFFGII